MLWHLPRRSTRRVVNGLVYLALFGLLLRFLGLDILSFTNFGTRRFDTWRFETCPGFSPFQKSCTTSRSLIAQQSTQIVLRTGATESQDKLRSHLESVLSPVPAENVLVLSDLEEEIDDYHVHDVYVDISEQERASYPDFALYDTQQLYKQQGKDTRELKGGWALGKYMNLPMKRKIWKMQQEIKTEALRKKWFVFIEADTFVEWDNLFFLLEHLDPTKKMYLGSPVWLSGLQFAHGGSAYVLSYSALEALNKPTSIDHGIFDSQFGVNVTALCCGDEALARALKPRGVTMKGYWPMFNGEPADSIAFGRDLWCEPLVSLHHISGDEIENLWQWVDDWKIRTKSMYPLLFKHLYEYIAPRLGKTQIGWDNTSDERKIFPKEKIAHTSVEHCKIACKADKLCFQFVFYGGKTCALSHHIRLGGNRSPERDTGEQYISGWDLERIRDWTTKTECKNAHWVKSNP